MTDSSATLPAKRLLKIAAACEVYSVSDDFLRKAIKTGQLKAIRPGYRSILLDVDDLERFFAKLKKAS